MRFGLAACAVWTASGTLSALRRSTESISFRAADWQLGRSAYLLNARFRLGFLALVLTESGVVAAQLDSRSSFVRLMFWLDHVYAGQPLAWSRTQIAELTRRVAHTRAGYNPPLKTFRSTIPDHLFNRPGEDNVVSREVTRVKSAGTQLTS